MKLKKLLLNLNMTQKYEGEDLEIFDISFDSRAIHKENAIFVCLKGENTDGHLFAKEALENGAKVIVCEKKLGLTKNEVVVNNTRQALALLASNFYENAHKKLKMIALTGTNGKTTTSFMIKSILEDAGKKVGLIGTTGAYVCQQFFNVNLTTPDPMDLHKLFLTMVNNNCEYCVMEASAHSIYYEKIFGIKFEFAILTNFTQDHLDFFKTMDNYKNVKAKLFTENYCKCIVCNSDDEFGKELCKNEILPTITYALNSPSDCFALDIIKKKNGSNFVLNLFDDVFNAEINLPGEFNVYNALCASTVAKLCGVHSNSIVQGLKNLKYVPGRFNCFTLFNGASVIIDFAHTPDGVLKVLTAIRELNPRRLITVFGCGGNRDKGKRDKMGIISEKLSDFTIITSDNPRFENPDLIIDDISKNLKSNRFVSVVDRKKAVEIALSLSKRDDIVAILGKGGENYQDINGVKVPYSDYEVVVNFNKKMETLLKVMEVK